MIPKVTVARKIASRTSNVIFCDLFLKLSFSTASLSQCALSFLSSTLSGFDFLNKIFFFCSYDSTSNF